MTKKYDYWIRSSLLLTLLISSVTTPIYSSELYDDKKVSQIEIIVDTPDSTGSYDTQAVLNRLKTKEGDDFSQLIFDNDLKNLSDTYEKVEPNLSLKNGKVAITIHVTPKPLIHTISISGNENISTQTLLNELNIKENSTFNRQSFNKSFNKIKSYYFKKGYFESQIDYTIEPIPNTNEIDVHIHINEGRSGLIESISFKGFTQSEESDITQLMHLQKYNFWISWLTGSGIYSEEAIEQDKMIILNYLHNKGYADASVDVQLGEDPETKKLTIEMIAHRGSQYHVGTVSISGNQLYSTEDLRKKIQVEEGAIYSPDKIRESAQEIKDYYGQKGYIDANVQYEPILKENEPIFDLEFYIDEGREYKIGLIHIFGNSATKNNVILRESLLVPGETFDSRKLKATQQKLEAIGYFKSVNVYAVRSCEDEELGEAYRDVYIEVEETTTGSASLFMGFSTSDSITGGVDITERNFRLASLGRALRGDGLSSLRGGGEYLHLRGTAGAKQYNVLLSWMNPYVNDTLWRLGVELTQTYSKLQEKEQVVTYGGSINTSYPITRFWTPGMRQRVRYIDDHLELSPITSGNPICEASLSEAKKQFNISGTISALSGNLSYDSIDNSLKPHRGWKSYLESEVAGIWGKFQFYKLTYNNSIYFPIWAKGTLKLRGDFKFIFPFGGTNKEGVPYSERFFMGGDQSMRGYKPFYFGPRIYLKNALGGLTPTQTPYGGLSAIYLSLEYNQEIFRMLDLFTFVDVGSLNFDVFSFKNFRTTAGVGARLDIGNRLPIMVGWGYVFNELDRKGKTFTNGTEYPKKSQPMFFSMGGQF